MNKQDEDACVQNTTAQHDQSVNQNIACFQVEESRGVDGLLRGVGESHTLQKKKTRKRVPSIAFGIH
jgi:hypothetical protein